MRSWVVANINADGTIAGRSQGLASVANPGAGVYTLTLAAGYAIDSVECVHSISERGVLAASGASSFALAHTSDTVKSVTALREGAAGAASAATNIAFSIVLYSTTAGEDVD